MTTSAVANPLLVLGTGTFAEEIADVVGDGDAWTVAGFVENRDRARCDTPLRGRPVHWIDDLADFIGTHRVLCGLGTTQRDEFTQQADARGAKFATVVHDSALVSPTTTLETGCIVGVRVVIAAYTKLGRHVSVNRGAMIGHHTTIDDFVTVGPGANIAGNCRIGRHTYIGMGAIVIDHVSIGAGCVVGAGAVVTRDLPDRVLAVGVPARVVRENVEPK